MAGGASSNGPKARKRVEADATALKRARDGSAFARCEECHKDVPVVLIDMHNCSLEAKIKMNLEAHVVEKASEPKKKSAERKRTAPSSSSEDPKPKKSRKLRKIKDPNAPKRPQSGFFLFMEDFRKTFKEENPDAKGGAHVAKEGGDKWKKMSDEEKKVYTDKALELKEEYEKAMLTYQAENEKDEGGSDKEVEELCDDDA